MAYSNAVIPTGFEFQATLGGTMIWQRQRVSEMRASLPREYIIRQARVAILDDETPELLKDLSEKGLAVDHLESAADPRFANLESGHYDLLLLDYGGVGGKFGKDDGLDVLRHLKRVSPAVRILAFSGRRFDSSKADFFRLADGILNKDAGFREVLEQVEQELQLALTPAHQFKALLELLNPDGDLKTSKKIEAIVNRSARKKDDAASTIQKLKKAGIQVTTKAIEATSVRLLELAIVYIFGTGS